MNRIDQVKPLNFNRMIDSLTRARLAKLNLPVPVPVASTKVGSQ